MATHIPESPYALLTRDQAAAASTESGFPVAPKTLAWMQDFRRCSIARAQCWQKCWPAARRKS